jgi:hypothetical protein
LSRICELSFYDVRCHADITDNTLEADRGAAQIAARSRFTGEIRRIIGVHLGRLDLIVNPILDTDIDGFGKLACAPATRIAYSIGGKLALALEPTSVRSRRSRCSHCSTTAAAAESSAASAVDSLTPPTPAAKVTANQ